MTLAGESIPSDAFGHEGDAHHFEEVVGVVVGSRLAAVELTVRLAAILFRIVAARALFLGLQHQIGVERLLNLLFQIERR